MGLLAKLVSPFKTRRMAVLFFLGFSSGLPFALTLTGGLFGAVFKSSGMNIKTISALASVTLPYTFKFAYAPLLDRYALPWLGRRRGWILMFQLCLVVAIIGLGQCDPRTQLPWVVGFAIAVAFFSASQDIVIDAYTTEILAPEERAAGAATSTMGYRVALLITGTIALGLGDYLPWRTIYTGLGVLMGACVLATFAAREPELSAGAPRTLANAVIHPLVEIFMRATPRAASPLDRHGRASSPTRTRILTVAALLFFIALYKFGDSLAGTVTTSFYSELHFTWTEIAGLSKALGFFGTLLGAAAAGALVPLWGMRRCLIVFGIAQAATNLLFTLLATHVTHNLIGGTLAVMGSKPMLGLAATVFADNVTGAMGAGAFVAFLMSQVNREYTATQYALFTGLSSMGSRVFGFAAGEIIATTSWATFYAITAAIALPGILLVMALPADEREKAREKGRRTGRPHPGGLS